MSKIQQTGRSMVEMLGVLAIIGVLSVGGIYGYSIAMRSYRVNEIVNGVSLLYMVGRAQNNGEGVAELDYTSVFSSLPKGVEFMTYEDHKISVKTTDKSDCSLVREKVVSVGLVSATLCSEGTTVITFEESNGGESGGGSGGSNNTTVGFTSDPTGTTCEVDNTDIGCYGGKSYSCGSSTGNVWREQAETNDACL